MGLPPVDVSGLQLFWFVIIAVLWTGYFVLDGFDLGVGVLLPFVGKNEAERRAVLTTLGPVWDGNEVWLLTAGGATFAAFPEWYATLFSGFYLPLLLILVGLILRGVAFEYRSKRSDGNWRRNWDAALWIGSFLPALLWGVAFGNIVRGVALKANPQGGALYDGSFWDLLNIYSLIGGLTTLLLFTTHGAIFLSLKTGGTVRERAHALVPKIGLAAAVFAVVFLLWSQLAYSNGHLWTWVPVLLAAVCWLVGLGMDFRGRDGLAFLFSAVTLGLAVFALFGMLFPYVMPNIDRSLPGLTIAGASSTPYTLTVMTWVALILTPIVLCYQAWSYWVFRKRITAEMIPNPEQGSLDEVARASA
jgi:cytochrome d ubiquinol oxidase subunit II